MRKITPVEIVLLVVALICLIWTLAYIAVKSDLMDEKEKARREQFNSPEKRLAIIDLVIVIAIILCGIWARIYNNYEHYVYWLVGSLIGLILGFIRLWVKYSGPTTEYDPEFQREINRRKRPGQDLKSPVIIGLVVFLVIVLLFVWVYGS